MNRRVVVSGIGVLAPGIPGRDGFWNTISAGRAATRRITAFDPSPFRSQIAAECDFDPLAHGFTAEEAARLDRATQFAVAAADEALADSGASPVAAPHRWGAALGSAVGATIGLDREYATVSGHGAQWSVDHRRAVDHLYDYFVPSSICAEVARRAGIGGPVTMVSTGCTSGIDAVGHATELISDGAADVMITGATDAPISPITVACFDAIKATTARNDEAVTASRPFDLTRDGFVLGEGAACFVLEELDHARRRGAPVYGEVRGYATRCNAYHMTGLRSDGRELAEASTAALKSAGTEPVGVGYVNAHGSGTQQNDRHETAAVKKALGPHAYRVPISSIKSMVGHSLGAIGSIEIAACLLGLTEGLIPPTANLHEPDPDCDLDYVPVTARKADFDTALTVGSGFGGFQSAMVLSNTEVATR